jgi:hypothetical protein
MQPQVKFGAMLDNRFVERREEDMVFITEFRDGHDEQSVIFSRIAIHNGCAVICSFPVGTEHFTAQ